MTQRKKRRTATMKLHSKNEAVSTLRAMLFGLVFAVGSLALVACEEQGPAEEAGENLDETLEEAGDKMQDAADEVEEETDR